MSAVDTVRARLAALSPQTLTVEDDSAAHAGHAEAGNGAHLRLHIVAAAFAGLPPLKRHRLVHQAIGNLPAAGIHALVITARTPDETGDSFS